MHRYCGKTWSSEDIERIRAIIAASSTANRAQLSRLVCESFNWRKPDGLVKEMSCRVAMLRMQRDGLISLPAAKYAYRRISGNFASQQSDPQPVFQGSVNELVELRVELVTNASSRALWNEFIARYHYLGYKMLPGAQLRYLIADDKRVLGAMGFGAAAWKVAPRDQFIGWTAPARESRLHFIVNQSRFLILPWIQCRNLATKSLAMVTRRLADDWQTRYMYRPVLMETFVDTTRFSGTCYKAGNWICVGRTQGRTRCDRYHTKSEPIKSIWLMPLYPDFRRVLVG